MLQEVLQDYKIRELHSVMMLSKKDLLKKVIILLMEQTPKKSCYAIIRGSLAEVLSGRIKNGDKALVDIDDNKKVTINISSEESPQELASANF